MKYPTMIYDIILESISKITKTAKITNTSGIPIIVIIKIIEATGTNIKVKIPKARSFHGLLSAKDEKIFLDAL